MIICVVSARLAARSCIQVDIPDHAPTQIQSTAHHQRRHSQSQGLQFFSSAKTLCYSV